MRVVVGLLAAALSLLAEPCWAEGGDPSLAERVIWAVNAGGEAHVDVHGIHFRKDPLEGKVGKGEWCCRRAAPLGVGRLREAASVVARLVWSQHSCRAPPFCLEVEQVLI